MLTLSDIQLKLTYLDDGYARSTSPAAQLLITSPQLGQLLLSTRKRRGLTQTAVAHRLGLSQNRISHLEQHPDEISVKQLLSWCSAIGLELRLGERIEGGPSSSTEW